MRDIKDEIQNLPAAPGVYLFYDRAGSLVYVGKAASLKDRVRSYFQGQRTSRPIEEMIHEVAGVKWRETESALEAVILESIFIKKYQPKYNLLGKDDKSWNYIVISRDAYPRISVVRQHDIDARRADDPKGLRGLGELFGPYPGVNAAAVLNILRRLFRFSTCEPHAQRPCLYYEMGRCLGVCAGKITPGEYRRRVIAPLKWFLFGRKRQAIRTFERQMELAAGERRFEDAAALRDQLRALKRIQDVALLNKDFFAFEPERFKAGWETGGNKIRIEGYDVSNLGPTDKVGSMIVFDAVGPVKSEYRQFNIKTVPGQSDVDCLAEVLERRLKHAEWPRPDVALVDGGRPQVSRIKKVFNNFRVAIPLVGIAKGPRRKRNDIILGNKDERFVRWAAAHRTLLIRVRDEAHRFAIAFNRSKRKIRV